MGVISPTFQPLRLFFRRQFLLLGGQQGMNLVLHPRLEPGAFDMERRVVLEELAQTEDQPEEVAVQQLLSR